jgi:hypothetical protein
MSCTHWTVKLVSPEARLILAFAGILHGLLFIRALVSYPAEKLLKLHAKQVIQMMDTFPVMKPDMLLPLSHNSTSS